MSLRSACKASKTGTAATLMPCALTIAGSDPSGGAGIQGDLKTFASLKVYGVAALTALTIQNTIGVKEIVNIPTEVVRKQVDVVVEDIGVDAAKTGMLYTAGIVKVVAEEIEEHGFPLVVDPVLVSTTGTPLLKPEAIETLVRFLLPLATIVTPNAPEASVLAHLQVTSLKDVRKAAERIAAYGPKAVVVKGGHISHDRAVDILYVNGEFKELEAEWVDTKTSHGAGCCFSAAITAQLAKGMDVFEAVEVAKVFVTRALKHGLLLGKGNSPVNPMAHLYQESEKWFVVQNIRKALRILESHPTVTKLIPEVQSNLVMAPNYTVDYLEFAGVPGRIVRLREGVKASADPEFGVSTHVASTLAVAITFNPEIRAGMNIRYTDQILSICKELGYTTSSYDRGLEPEDVKKAEGASTHWGAKQAIRRLGKVPDIIYHEGDWGKEPLITVLGRTAVDVVDKVLRIAEKL